MTALSGRKWDLDKVEQILSGDTDDEAVADVNVLQRLSQIQVPPGRPSPMRSHSSSRP